MKTLVEFVKNGKHQRVGVVVAIGRNKLGWSKYNQKAEMKLKKKFDSQLAIKIAIGRAVAARPFTVIPGKISEAMKKMKIRSENCFKEEG